MSREQTPEDVVAAWKDQPTTGFRLSNAELMKRIRTDQRRQRRGLVATVGLIVFCVAWFAGILVIEETDTVRRIGLLATVGGLAYTAWQLIVHFRRVHAARIDADRTTADSVTAMRAYLLARYEFHSGVWLWSRLTALLPGVPIVAYGFARDPELADTMMVVPVTYVPFVWIAALACVALFVQLPWARRYKQQIHELDRLAAK
jgi:hypothetical protein